MGRNSHYSILDRLLLLHLLLHLKLLMSQGVECIDSVQKGIVGELLVIWHDTNQIVPIIMYRVLLKYNIDWSSRFSISSLLGR